VELEVFGHTLRRGCRENGVYRWTTVVKAIPDLGKYERGKRDGLLIQKDKILQIANGGFRVSVIAGWSWEIFLDAL